jgi:hypothetical protein
MFIVADQVLCHLVGDYIFQSDWMALNKTKNSKACLAHAFTYTLPFCLMTLDLKALVFILLTHFVIDRWRLVRYVNWIKNFLAPKWLERLSLGDTGISVQTTSKGSSCDAPLVKLTLIRNHPWVACEGTGYHKDRPPWMAVWLMIIADNTLHILLNGLALKYISG